MPAYGKYHSYAGIRYRGTLEIINNTRRGIVTRVKFGSVHGNARQIEILDEHNTILGFHLKPDKSKTCFKESQNWVFYIYALHVITTNINFSPPIF